MAYNPFLSMNEPSAPATTDVLNPFMMTDTETDAFAGDNPFATSNPFSDFGSGYEPPAGDTVPVDIFGSIEPTGIGAKQFEGFTENSAQLDIFTSGPEELDRLVKPTDLELVTTTANQPFLKDEEIQGPQLPARPLPPETQNLILSVTGQMEFTSSHLLDRIPPTRTPSPVSVRDIHSPSPTPEPDPAEEPPSENFDINRNKPVRPPPARPPPAARPPPPRPQPPRPTTAPPVPPAPIVQPVPSMQQTEYVDDINLFDAPVPAPVKPTKEAIMSLYSAPKEETKQIDFLSDDIVDDIPSDASHQASQPFGEEIANSASFSGQMGFESQEKSVSNSTAFPPPMDTVTDTAAPMDCTEAPGESAFPTSNTSPFAETIKDELPSPQILNGVQNPFESMSEPLDTSEPFPEHDVFGVKSEDIVMVASGDVFNNAQDNIFEPVSMTDMDQSQPDIFPSSQNFGDGSQAFSVNTEEAFETSGPSPSTDVNWGAPAEATMQDSFPRSQDAFDAFSAKFDATASNNLNTGWFYHHTQFLLYKAVLQAVYNLFSNRSMGR